ncbi:MmgE/PrpD family protein [Paraburkholderia sp. MPAMCS5]|uniref:MmgE/PrpD family protein n=1 Tax=Paraburkholderia sp. MPAMCS5 TaxID=3112563 RepID=UPI002E1783C6|nr:MmgE/PrpD family protein [Paraburkholderia sp. MPAMCS5]
MIVVGNCDRGELAPSIRSLTDTVAEFAANLRYEEIPAEVVKKVKLHLLDTIACAVGGANTDIAEISRVAGHGMSGDGTCAVYGSDALLTPAVAAFTNSNIANALDFDDGTEMNGKGLGHPGASLVPAALAGLAENRIEGKRLVTALAAGYEVNNRLIVAVQPSAERFEEVYGVGQHQSIGAAVAYGILLKLSGDAMHNAIGLAGTLTSVPSLHKYNWNERPIVSFKDGVAPAAMAGVNAGNLTLAGFIGSKNLFDGNQGFWRMLGSDRFDGERLTSDLGRDWATMNSSFKVYPACRWLAPALEAFEALLSEAAIRPSDIASIEVHTFSKIEADLMERRPKNAIDGQFSLPYLLAVLAHRKQKGAPWFDTQVFGDPEIHRIADKVVARVDAGMDAAMRGENRRPSATVLVTTQNGKQFKRHINAPLGSRIRPVGDDVVIAKAQSNLEIGGIDAERMIAYIESLGSNEERVSQDALVRGVFPG